MQDPAMLLTAAIFFLLVAIAAGFFSLMIKNALMPILFFVALLMFVWSGILHLRERRRGVRRCNNYGRCPELRGAADVAAHAAVATCRLGAVERAVGVGDPGAVVVVLRLHGGVADAHRDAHAARLLEHRLLDAPADAFGDGRC